MKGSSKVVMAATMAIVILLLVVLALVLVLLAELYCSLLFRRRKLDKPGTKPEPLPVSQPQQQAQNQSNPSPLSSFYAQGVLDAPRSFLFPKLPSKREGREHQNNGKSYDLEKLKQGKLHQFLSVQSPCQIGLGKASPSPSYISITKPEKAESEGKVEKCYEKDESCCSSSGGGSKREDMMYISNPIYDNGVARPGTPFETPGSSPSLLDPSGSSGYEKKENAAISSPVSLPLTPMKKLPVKASSIALSFARSLGTSNSDSNSHMGRFSSSSGSPCTSPSW